MICFVSDASSLIFPSSTVSSEMTDTVSDIILTPWSSILPLESSSSPVEISGMPISSLRENTVPLSSSDWISSTDILSSSNIDTVSSDILQTKSIFPSLSELVSSDLSTSLQEISASKTEYTSYFSLFSPTAPLTSLSPVPVVATDLLTPSFSDLSVSTLITDSSSTSFFHSNQAASDSLWSSALIDFQTSNEYPSSFYLTDSYLSLSSINSENSNNPSKFDSVYTPSLPNSSFASYSQVSYESFISGLNGDKTSLIESTSFDLSSEFVSSVSTFLESQTRSTDSWATNTFNSLTILASNFWGTSVSSSNTQSYQEITSTSITNSYIECCSSSQDQSTEWTLSGNSFPDTILDSTLPNKATVLASAISDYSIDNTFSTTLDISKDLLQTSKHLLICVLVWKGFNPFIH